MEYSTFKRIPRNSIFLSTIIASFFCSTAYSQTLQVTVTGPTTFTIQVSNVYNWRVERKVNNSWNTFISGGASGHSGSHTLPGGTHTFRLYNCYNVSNSCSTSSNKSIYLTGETPPPQPPVQTPTVTYTYDALGRLTYVSDTVAGNRDYDYDAAGNRRLVSTNTTNDEEAEPTP